MNWTHGRPTRKAWGSVIGLVALLGVFAACSGGDPGTADNKATEGARARLLGVEYGRLVDIYAWRRVDAAVSDRLHPASRTPVLVQREILINTQIRDEDPFNNTAARYRFMPYDPKVGHRELLILFDDQLETTLFERALESARVGLATVAPYFAFSTGLPTPPPLVPRDAALRLSFDRPLGLSTEFFEQTPTAVQVLLLNANPASVSPSVAYQPVTCRVISKENGRYLIVDPEISGDEAKNRSPNSTGLPPSLDDSGANIRLALPTSGTIKSFRVQADIVPVLNSVGVNNEAAVIRDFRSGNPYDDNNGYVGDEHDPQVVGRKDMGILSVDLDKRVLYLNKRFADVIIRGRLPFVDGPIDATTGQPQGPQKVPQGVPLLHGDVIWQDVLTPGGETVRVKAEVIRNLDIPADADATDLAVGGEGPTARVEVATVAAFDSKGNVVNFQANDLPLGADCTAVVHYQHQLKIQNGAKDVGDSGRVAEFLTVVPAPPRLDPVTRLPIAPNERISPTASIALTFSKPMALGSVRPEDNFVIANRLGAKPEFIAHVKVGTLAVVPTMPTDLFNDATSIRLLSPLGLFHRNGTEEQYYLHLRDGSDGPRDRSGRQVNIHDIEDVPALSGGFKLDKDAPNNLVGGFVRRMNSPDEDGTSDSAISLDYFGQFQQRDGRLFAWPTTRFSKVADQTTLSAVRLDLGGECRDSSNQKVAPCPGVPNPMYRYQTPLMIFQGLGGIAEPLVAQGSRMQITYREDDLQLAYTVPSELEIDVEQLHWGPFVGRTPALLTYDLFDRVSIVLGTSEKRPDMRSVVVTQGPNQCCAFDSATFNSGLTTSFEGNYIDNGVPVEVVKDKVYAINPNNAFATVNGSTMIGWPRFDRTYTWRDRRYMAWDMQRNQAPGLGGSQNPTDPNQPDRTKDISSPHIPEVNPDIDGVNAKQEDDYRGDYKQDHGPYALPLLVDFFIYPDDPANGVATAANLFQIGYIGPPYPAPGHGYYNRGWPWLRVHTTGGFDTQQAEILVDPKNSFVAIGGWVTNAILGRFFAPPGDDHIYWGQADFVRKVSVVTYGYIDTLMPGKNDVTGPSGWPADKNGFPNLAGVSTLLRPAEWSVLLSPAPEDLPLGTKVLVEYRGSENFDKSDAVYKFDSAETAKSRNNLLNPHFACEQFRYLSSGRVQSTGFTNYVRDLDDLLDNRTLVAPRFLNFRFTFVNNTAVTPARMPYVDYFGVVYRVQEPK